MIHKFSHNGNIIVLDVGSGSVHVVDQLTAQLLDCIKDENGLLEEREYTIPGYTLEEVEESLSEIRDLVQAGTLFSTTDYRKYTNKMGDSPVKAMCLHVAHDCNLRCKYCFASTGDFEGTRSLMSGEIGKKAIDFLLEHSGKRHHLELDFFGGEPLMNFGVVKEVVEYARQREKEFDKVFRFTITTNGVLLDDEKIDFINREMHNVVLSLDGRPEINDRLRTTVGGTGSYDRIVPKFQKLVEGRGDGQYYLRGTFTRHNLDFANDVVHMADLGFRQLSVEPVVGEEEEEYSLRKEDLPAVFAEYERLANLLSHWDPERKSVNFFHFKVDLSGGPCAIKRLRGCGCGNEYVAVTPEGDIYPCHQFVGMEEWKMGNLLEERFDLEQKSFFSSINIYSRKGCADCWAQFFCSGGCTANSVKYCNDPLKPHDLYCELEQKRVECALGLQVEKALATQNAKG